MELESESGSKIPIEPGSDTQIGRELGLGFGPSATDRTVSRRHLSLRPIDDPADKFRVGFDVTGKNPIWVCFSNGGDGRIYKNSEKGELRIGDKLSLSIKRPSFWVVKRRRGEENEEDEERMRVLDAVARREKRTLERREKEEVSRGGEDDDDGGEEIGAVDVVSQIDPVKEFGFLVKGHEFDQYPKKRIIAAKNWDWFLEEPSENSDEDDTIAGATNSKRKKGMTRKKKKCGANDDDDDDEWTGESEDEKEDVAVRGGSNKRPKHSTRSKDLKIPRNDATGARNPVVCDSEIEEEDEEDETLGGFVVDDDEEEEVVEDEESEDEFDDEEDDEDK